MIKKEDLRIVFFGTPQFAVESLRLIIENNYNVVAVITAPDKPAGRGYQLRMSAVKQFALNQQIPVLQPTNLKSDEFINDLKNYQAQLQIVIAFRILPLVVWNMPPLGTFNLHASYLPNYRGAAPINWAVINGEKETGVTTFFLKHEIDTGSIILQEKTEILPNENAGILHDKLMIQGADLVVKSLNKILEEDYSLQPQMEGEFPHARKIFTEQCKIDWNNKAVQVHNLIRGLSPYPAAFTSYNDKSLKIFDTEMTSEIISNTGSFEIRNKNEFLVNCADYKLKIISLQPEGKKRMSAIDFLNGLRN
ncbi:MAG: methionyl-tRNA formyltransferase [Bacteroidetes bacterium]|nr:methionyl-tRNA formyltransferase [Bacteroidota bacterium]